MRRALLLALLGLGIALGPAWADITTGLIAHYPFDGDATDASGNGNHGSLVGGMVATTDRFGNPNTAYEFNGLNSYILVPNSASLSSPSTACTQAGWVMLYGVSKVGSGFNPLIMKSADGANAFMYRMIANPTYIGAAFNNWNTATSGAQTTPLNEWHHVVTVFNSSTLKFYYDGTLVGTLPMVMTIAADTRPLTIGADVPGILEIFFGKIDDVRLYNRALTDADVLQLWAGGSTGVASRSTPPLTLGHSMPNPSGAESRVEFTLESEASVQLDVFDVAGRRVRGLESGVRPAGQNFASWDGHRDDGSLAPSGVYFFRLKSGDRVLTSRVVRVR
jgi:Concanavalin A-like lectin/glucanases superfamily/FlgD Ig-like domain